MWQLDMKGKGGGGGEWLPRESHVSACRVAGGAPSQLSECLSPVHIFIPPCTATPSSPHWKVVVRQAPRHGWYHGWYHHKALAESPGCQPSLRYSHPSAAARPRPWHTTALMAPSHNTYTCCLCPAGCCFARGLQAGMQQLPGSAYMIILYSR